MDYASSKLALGSYEDGGHHSLINVYRPRQLHDPSCVRQTILSTKTRMRLISALLALPVLRAHPLHEATQGDAIPAQKLTISTSPTTAAYVPRVAITKPTIPPSNHKSLQLRQVGNVQTCGFINGDPASPVRCASSGLDCYTSAQYHGCCNTLLSEPNCLLPTSCLPFSSLTACSGTCSLDPYATRCTDSASPFCYTLAYSYSSVTKYQYECAATPSSVSVEITPTTEPLRLVNRQASNATTFTFAPSPPSPSPEPGGNPGRFATDFPTAAVAAGTTVPAVFILALIVWWRWPRKQNKKEEASYSTQNAMTDHASSSAVSSASAPHVAKPATTQPALGLKG
ncbi:hypothetical protein BDV95DRAFT_380241 [Massariosphaeria phaeospora]|uniref:Mid2 domain-containing protein n=1 Tax=Massariosphaeria phaeospora TaxID=100035 RepID=A0A7C8MB80_9PLEO|nr:hypothetical protein BDV95DRAFT_380241 [Massariosphaeria phaeospora]